MIFCNKFLKLISNNLYAFSLYSRKIASALGVFFIARYLSVYNYGIYSSYTSIATYILLLANLGYNEYILVSANNETKLVKIKQIFFISLAIFITIFYSVLSLFFPLEKHFIFILVLLKCFFDGTFFMLVLPYFQSSDKLKEIGIINICYSFFAIFIALLALLFKFSLEKYLILYVILGIINFIQCSFYIKINYFKVFKLFKNIKKIIDKRILNYTTVTALFLTREAMPALIVSTVFPKETAALFFASYNIATIPSLFATAQLQQILPEMINKSKQEVIKIMKKGALTIFYINLAVVIFLFVFGKSLLIFVYNKDYYISGFPILILLSIITMFSGVSGVLGTYITASGNQKFKQRCQIEAFILSVISLAVLYRYGIYAILSFFFIIMAYFIPRYGFFIKKHLDKI